MLKRTAPWLTLIAGGLLATAAIADTKSGTEAAKATDEGMSQTPEFSELDVDGDGYISEADLEQAPTDLPVEHSTLDTNGDGRVDRTEFAALERLEAGDPSEPVTTEAEDPTEIETETGQDY